MKQPIFLTKDNVFELVMNNKYKLETEDSYISRCVTGRYDNEKGLPMISLPGGDAGELALLYSTAHSHGFEVLFDKAFLVLCTLIGGIQHFSLHTDNPTKQSLIGSGCFYMNEIYTDPVTYSLEETHMEVLKKQLAAVKARGVEEKVLSMDSVEGAILLVKGEMGIYPQYEYESELDGRDIKTQVYVYQKTLVNRRRKIFVDQLIAENAVKMFEGCDDEYLYQVLSNEAENHLFEFLKKRADGLPIYAVEIDDKQKISIEHYDNV